MPKQLYGQPISSLPHEECLKRISLLHKAMSITIFHQLLSLLSPKTHLHIRNHKNLLTRYNANNSNVTAMFSHLSILFYLHFCLAADIPASSHSKNLVHSYLTICWITFYICTICTILFYSLRVGIS